MGKGASPARRLACMNQPETPGEGRPRGYSRAVRIAAAKVAVKASEKTADPIPDEVRELAKADH